MWYFKVFNEQRRRGAERKGTRRRPVLESRPTDTASPAEFEKTIEALEQIVPLEQLWIFNTQGKLLHFSPDIPWNVGYLRRSIDQLFSTIVALPYKDPELLVTTPKRLVIARLHEDKIVGMTVSVPYPVSALRLTFKLYSARLAKFAFVPPEGETEQAERFAMKLADVLEKAFAAFSKFVGAKVAWNFYDETRRYLHKPVLISAITLDKRGKASVKLEQLVGVEAEEMLMSVRMFLFEYARHYFQHIGEMRSLDMLNPLLDEIEMLTELDASR